MEEEERKLPCTNVFKGGYESEYRTIETLFLTALGFSIPFIFGGPQILVGSLVNALLVRAALTMPAKRAIPVALAPSAGAVMHGVLFGPFSVFIVYFMPFIWTGNMILIYVYRTGLNYAAKVVTAATAKGVFLFAFAYLLYSMRIVPRVFLESMGIMQVITAALGGCLALILFGAKKQ